MTKIAVFVEGQTELVFVREYLLKWFAYENISIECFTYIAAIMGALQKEDFEDLLKSGKCSSFKQFATVLVQ